MTSITTRAGKGSPLTHNEVDANFTNLNNDKLDTAGIALGSAASPTIKFTGDLNTGIYSPGADQLAVSTGGTGRLFVDATGNVGLGTGATNIAGFKRIEIGEAGVSGGLLTLRSSGGAQEANISCSATGLAFTTNSYATPFDARASEIILGTGSSGTECLRIDSSGRVGIGTASPNANLHIAGPTAPLLRIGDFDNSRSINSEIRLNRAGGVSATSKLSFYNGANSTAEAQIYRDSNGLFTLSDNHIFLSAASSEYMRIDSSGRVGIGTSSPLSNFVVQSDSANTAFDTPYLNYAAVCRNDNQTNNNYVGLSFATKSTTGQEMSVASMAAQCTNHTSGTVNGHLGFFTTGSSTLTERMRIGSTGTTIAFASGNDTLVVRNANGPATNRSCIVCTNSSTGMSDGPICLAIYTNGNVQNTNNSYGGLSDIKLKENIVDATSQWNDIKALQVRKYNFKEGQTHTQIGLVAQEVELVSPGLVGESPDRDEDGNDLGTVTKSVNYSVLYMKAVKALQEAMERIETLEAAVAALQSA